MSAEQSSAAAVSTAPITLPEGYVASLEHPDGSVNLTKVWNAYTHVHMSTKRQGTAVGQTANDDAQRRDEELGACHLKNVENITKLLSSQNADLGDLYSSFEEYTQVLDKHIKIQEQSVDTILNEVKNQMKYGVSQQAVYTYDPSEPSLIHARSNMSLLMHNMRTGDPGTARNPDGHVAVYQLAVDKGAEINAKLKAAERQQSQGLDTLPGKSQGPGWMSTLGTLAASVLLLAGAVYAGSKWDSLQGLGLAPTQASALQSRSNDSKAETALRGIAHSTIQVPEPVACNHQSSLDEPMPQNLTENAQALEERASGILASSPGVLKILQAVAQKNGLA